MMLIKTDDYIIDQIQAVYDFIWDNFGITKGAISVIRRFACALLLFIATDVQMPFRAIWIAYYMCTAYKSYVKFHVPQTKGQYKEMNKRALESRQGTMQKTKLYFLFPAFVIAIWYFISIGSYTYAFLAFSDITATYLITILIRDREPTESAFSFKGT